MVDNRRARWKRFSLRTLFALLTASCLFLGMWSAYVNPYRRQLQSLAEVKRLQGEFEIESAEGPAWQRWLVTTLVGDNAFVRVRRVNLAGRQVNDDALWSLTGLTHLTDLCLDHTNVTDNGTSAFRSMPELRTLSLKYTPISDGSAVVLCELPNASSLRLTGTKLSDETVPHFAEMRQLSELYVRWTYISDNGARKLADALPNCKVLHHALVNAISTAPKYRRLE